MSDSLLMQQVQDKVFPASSSNPVFIYPKLQNKHPHAWDFTNFDWDKTIVLLL